MQTMNPTRIIIFAKAPVAGYAKTRLIPALGAEGASRLARRMLAHTVGNALRANLGPVELCAAPSTVDPAWRELDLPPELQWSEQGEGDLGARMARAASRGLDAGLPVLLIGTDCPALDSDVLRAAASALNKHDAAITPTADGGYALLGLNRFHASLFDNMCWSVSTVADETLDRMARIGWHVARLAAQHDIDEPPDLQWLPAGWLPNVIKALTTN